MTFGVIAQLGERLNGIQEVRSSILLSSTNFTESLPIRQAFFFLWSKVNFCLYIYFKYCYLWQSRTNIRFAGDGL